MSGVDTKDQVDAKQRFLAFLETKNLRITAPRCAIIDAAFGTEDHFTAEQLLEKSRRLDPSVSRATVYRTLDLFVECGLVRRHRLGGRGHVYEHVHAGQRHDHLVCSECGRVVEFVSPGIEALQAEICRAHGFEHEIHSMQIQGVCTSCAR